MTIKDLDVYRKELTPNIKEFVDSSMRHATISINDTINKWLMSLDCRRLLKNKQINNTLSYRYKRLMCELLYAIDNYIDEWCKEDFIAEVIHVHTLNLEYEKEHPPVDYNVNKKKSTSKTKTKTVKEKEVKEKEHKVSSAERKLMAKITKLNTLMFNISVK